MNTNPIPKAEYLQRLCKVIVRRQRMTGIPDEQITARARAVYDWWTSGPVPFDQLEPLVGDALLAATFALDTDPGATEEVTKTALWGFEYLAGMNAEDAAVNGLLDGLDAAPEGE